MIEETQGRSTALDGCSFKICALAISFVPPSTRPDLMKNIGFLNDNLTKNCKSEISINLLYLSILPKILFPDLTTN